MKKGFYGKFNFEFWKGDWALSYVLAQFLDLPTVFLFSKIFGKS